MCTLSFQRWYKTGEDLLRFSKAQQMSNLVDVSWVLKGRFSASINIVQDLSFILLAFVP